MLLCVVPQMYIPLIVHTCEFMWVMSQQNSYLGCIQPLHVHTHTLTKLSTYLGVCVCVYVCVCIFVYVCTCIFVCILFVYLQSRSNQSFIGVLLAMGWPIGCG